MTKTFRLSQYPFIFMAGILNRVNNNLLVALRPHGISIPMWRALAILQEKDGLTVGQLSEAIFVERSVLSRVIDGMEASGLVRREAHQRDRRYTRIFLDVQGRRLFQEILPSAKGQIEWALDGLSKAELRSLQHTLQRIQQNFDRIPYPKKRRRL